jgi:hypothetical protein
MPTSPPAEVNDMTKPSKDIKARAVPDCLLIRTIRAVVRGPSKRIDISLELGEPVIAQIYRLNKWIIRVDLKLVGRNPNIIRKEEPNEEANQ